MNQPTLPTERLILERFKESDLQDILDYASDPKVAETTSWKPHTSLEDSRKYFDWIEENTSLTPGKLFLVWGIREKESNKVIGSIDFKNAFSHSAQFDYAIGSLYWNKGYVTEAAKAILSWALEANPEIVRIQTYCIASNIGSRRVMEKCGLEFESIRKKFIKVKGRIVDTAHYALVR